MRRNTRYTVACLSGDGIGPELMAEASRALVEAGRLHGFRVDEVHAPFAGEAVSRHGHPLPASTRAACRDADAVLVALTREPALEGVKAELDLTWRVQRVRLPDGDIAVVSPLDDQVEPFVVRRAFDLARFRHGRLTAVGEGTSWHTLVSWEADRHSGVHVELLSPSEALPLLMNAPDRFSVVVTPLRHAQLVGDLAAASRNGSRIVASGRLSESGPGIFGPTHGSAPDIAGQGVANPSGMLLAASLMLSEGSGRACGRAHPRAGGVACPRVGGPHRRPRRAGPGVDDPRLHGRGARADAVVTNRRRVSRGARVTRRMLGSDAVLRSLEAEGVDVVFGIPGGAILPVYDAIARGTDVRHVLARHEQGAGHMAEGYARASGRTGVAFATSGPGATNLVTPIADAWMDSTPLVCITGQVRSHLIGTDAFQECDITGVTTPIVKHSWLVQEVEEIPHVLKAAFHVARTGRCGPVLVDIPRDIQEAPLDFRYPDDVDLPGWKPPTRGHSRQIAEAAQQIARAERPVLYVGGGTVNADACAELLELAETGRLPVVTTLMAKSAFPETHELHFGWPGMHGPKWSNLAMNTCDLLVAVGARFDDRVTGKLSAFAPGATVVHLDIDAAEIGKLRRADIPVVGPLRQVLADLSAQLRTLPPPQTEPWLRRLESWREEFPLRYGDGDQLKPQRVLETLQRLTADRDDVIWTTGVGQHQMWAMQYLLCDRPRTFITSGGLGTMGYGVPAAIGAKAARPEATVVCVDGDGCFQMTGQELATAVLEDLPIVTVIVNNGYLGMVQQWQSMFFEERHSHVRLTHAVPDYAALARAYGAEGFTVDDEDELEDALEEALACGRTAVVDARVDPVEQCFPIIPAGAAALDLIEYTEPEATTVSAA